MQHPQAVTELLISKTKELGFDFAGVCAAARPPGADRFAEWCELGYSGHMHYLSNRAAAYADPDSVLDGVKSIVMLAQKYGTEQPRTATGGYGKVSRYAWGNVDYHDLLHHKLHELVDYLKSLVPDCHARGVVDTAPLMERDFARLAGLGWIGKHTLLLNREHGSWFFLAALLTDLELTYSETLQTDHCGTCTACLDACPTDAFPQPYVLDARRCISYLTIELRDMIPEELREGMGDWIFGCDICQDVCPWNRSQGPVATPEFAPRADSNPMELLALFELDDDAFRQRFRKTPLWRPRRAGILRNAAIVLGNQRHQPAIHFLTRGLEDQEPLVREACRWALEQIQSDES